MTAGELERIRLGVLHVTGRLMARAAAGEDIAAETEALLAGRYPLDGEQSPFPCRRETHSYIEAIYMLREETALHDDEVAAIVCAVSESTLRAVGEPRAAKIDPKTAAAAQASLPYCVAAALVLNRIDHAAFATEALREPRIRALLPKISCVLDPQMPAEESRVSVERTRGKPVECTVTVPLGGENNEMTADQIRDRFRDDMAFAGRGDIAEAVIAAVGRMKGPTDTHELRAFLNPR